MRTDASVRTFQRADSRFHFLIFINVCERSARAQQLPTFAAPHQIGLIFACCNARTPLHYTEKNMKHNPLPPILLGMTLLFVTATAFQNGVPADFWQWRHQLVLLSGILLMTAMSLAMLLAVRPAWLERPLGGLDKMYRLHKWVGVAGLAVGVVHWLTAHGGGHGFAGFGGAVSLSRGWWGRRTPSRNRPCSR